MRLYNDVIQESQLVYGDHTEHSNINRLLEEQTGRITELTHVGVGI